MDLTQDQAYFLNECFYEKGIRRFEMALKQARGAGLSISPSQRQSAKDCWNSIKEQFYQDRREAR